MEPRYRSPRRTISQNLAEILLDDPLNVDPVPVLYLIRHLQDTFRQNLHLYHYLGAVIGHILALNGEGNLTRAALIISASTACQPVFGAYTGDIYGSVGNLIASIPNLERFFSTITIPAEAVEFLLREN